MELTTLYYCVTRQPLSLCMCSFYRPVVALIEVEIYRVDHNKRARIRDEVATSLGPPDPTVLVQEKEEGASVNIPQLLETFRKFGDVVLVRVTDDAILVTFKKSTSAVSATAVKEVSLCASYVFPEKRFGCSINFLHLQ